MRVLSTQDTACEEFLLTLSQRGETVDRGVEESVGTILSDLRENGKDALLRWARMLDDVPPDAADLELPKPLMETAISHLSEADAAALKTAARRIRTFHERQMQESWLTIDEEGSLLGQMVQPLERVGVYVPGGKAAYPSSVLMNVIPARVAGVQEIIMCSPLSRSAPTPAVLAAAEMAGVDRIFCIGGAQAIGAMAYGIGDVPGVDKIVGPGNAYVATAKRMVYGRVDIDMIAGPSEILVVADGSVSASWAAADLLSQAEHDELAAAVMLTPSESYAREVAEELMRQLNASDRKEIAQASLQRFGGVLITRDLDEAIDLSARIAPEHLELLIQRPLEYIHHVRNAGAVFLGPWSPEAMGDYVAGPNHVLPTGGTARFSSPLGVLDFCKRISVVGISQGSLQKLGPQVLQLAEMEGLAAHAQSVAIRLKDAK
jgi:histidinol dehydrogenase